MKLPEGWYNATEEDQQRLAKELNLEVIEGHFLHNKNIKIVAHRDDATDDILCQHVGENDLYTVVHLTWSMKPEINTEHPSIEMHGTFQEFISWEEKYV